MTVSHIQKALIALGILFFGGSAAALFTEGLSAGIYPLVLLGVGFILYGVFLPRVKGARTMHIIVTCVCTVLLAASAALAVYGHSDNADYDEDVVIVLGAGLHNNAPSGTLEKRLDEAYAYYQRNPGVLFIVTGGLASEKQMSEAQAMENYLTAKGVPVQQIIQEDRAVDTKQNFRFALEIVRAHGFSEDSVAFITSGFHVYRAGLCAQQAGLSARHIGAPVPWYTIPVNYMREMMAMVKHWILD